MQVKLPKGTTARQIICMIKSDYLKVMVKGADEPILDGKLYGKVKSEESFWNVEDNEYLNINFEKMGEKIWTTVMAGDNEIDPKKVDNSKRVDEFDLETQGHLQKVLYEQERKRNGLPTTEEEATQKRVQELMKNNTDPNSPFQAPTYDPAKYCRKDGVNAPAIPFV